MSRNRAFAYVLAVVAGLAMTMGLMAVTATAASARPHTPPVQPHNHYPPLPAFVQVNKGVVRHNSSVRASGTMFGRKEKVVISVLFQPKGSHRWKTIKTTAVRTNRDGEFSLNVNVRGAGTIIITAEGRDSRRNGSAVVFVVDRRGGWSNWDFRRASYTPGATKGVADTSAAARTTPAEPGVSWLALAGLGVLAMAGSTVITRRVVRRRRG